MAQSDTSVITDEMRAEIGRESDPVTFEVDKTACRMFARAVGYSDPLFFDEEFAKGKGYRSIPAPVGFLGHPVYNPNAPQSARGGGGYFRADSPFKRILNGGTDIEYFDTVCAGDLLTATSKLVDLSEREGRLGPMLVTVTETIYRNEAGQTVAVVRGTGIQY